MVKRSIIEIDREKCIGCGECISNCHEGVLKIIEGKAVLVDGVYCDGLGNCLGHCPTGALKVIEKESVAFDFEKTNNHLKQLGRVELNENPMEKIKENTSSTFNEEVKNKLNVTHHDFSGCCSGFKPAVSKQVSVDETSVQNGIRFVSKLKQWPIQLKLLSPEAPFFKDCDLLVSADCVGSSNLNFQSDLLEGKVLCIGCPKLDDIYEYEEKLTAIIKNNNVKTVTVAIMEVPCCSRLFGLVEGILIGFGKEIPLTKVVVGINGEIIEKETY